MENNSREGDAVFDPFLGSGTSIIAAQQIDRICFGMEIDPKYVDVIVRRWQKFTGEQATLLDTNRTFDDIANERMTKLHGRKRTTTEADGAARS
jgi:DNA modification methylase